METSSCSVLTILASAIKGSLLIFQIINPIFIPYKVQTFFHLQLYSRLSIFFFYSLGWVSVVFWVNPLVLVSVLKVVSNLVGGLNEVIKSVIAGWVVVQVLFSNSEALELFNSIVVVGNLWESKWLFVNVHSMNFQGSVFTRFVLNLFFKLHGVFKVLLVQGDRELV